MDVTHSLHNHFHLVSVVTFPEPMTQSLYWHLGEISLHHNYVSMHIVLTCRDTITTTLWPDNLSKWKSALLLEGKCMAFLAVSKLTWSSGITWGHGSCTCLSSGNLARPDIPGKENVWSLLPAFHGQHRNVGVTEKMVVSAGGFIYTSKVDRIWQVAGLKRRWQLPALVAILHSRQSMLQCQTRRFIHACIPWLHFLLITLRRHVTRMKFHWITECWE